MKSLMPVCMILVWLKNAYLFGFLSVCLFFTGRILSLNIKLFWMLK